MTSRETFSSKGLCRRLSEHSTPGHRREEIAHEMHATPLPRGAAEDGRDRQLQAFVGIGRNEPYAAEAALDQAAEKKPSKGSIFRRHDVEAQDLPRADFWVRICTM
jgi:hypothetical protein